MPREQWPADQVEVIAADFAGEDGDRRQEIVFIGVNVLQQRAAIEAALDACLLNEDELFIYKLADNEQRRATFPSTFTTF